MFAAVALSAGWNAVRAADDRPNILWITCEDISPHLGCYGDAYAATPHVDGLASQGVLYTHAFAPIGVCAPSRSCLITGMYPPSLGSHHMRCSGTFPEFVRGYSHYLRDAGYYCTNNVKTDYNWAFPKATWDESSGQAHWRKRSRPDQPFFAVFNFTVCHESQIRLDEKTYQDRIKKYGIAPHDPAGAVLPPYHPDTPETRRDWARYADMITAMDQEAGRVLKELDDDGLADNTIVWFYSDHGAGLPRSKRWLYDSSLRVPLMIRFPEKWRRLSPDEGRPGTQTDRMVSFVDFGPTVLSLAGVPVPKHMQGRPFLGDQAAEPREFVYGFRDRMDERYDMLRAVRDKRFKYIRNYMPQLPYFHHQFVSYMYEMPTMQVWQRLSDAGKLSGPSALFMAPTKPSEELYDTVADPHEIHNLAGDAESQPDLQRLRRELRRWQEEIVDLGFLPEADLRSRFSNAPPFTAVRSDKRLYPFRRIADAADLASRVLPEAVPTLLNLLKNEDAAVRYWAATGLGALGGKAASVTEALSTALTDSAPSVRVAAADSLCRMEHYDQSVTVLIAGLNDDNEWVRLHAINILDRLDQRARPATAALEKSRRDKNAYVVRVAEHALRDLGHASKATPD